MRLWMLGALVVVSIVVGMVIYVPSLDYQETFMPDEPTAPPMANIAMADREITGPIASVDADPLPAPDPTPHPAEETDLYYDPDLAEGISDLFVEGDFYPIVLDIANLRWGETNKVAKIVRPDAPKAEEAALSTLQVEQGVLVLGEREDSSTLRLYSEEGELEKDFALRVKTGSALEPMANPDCAYIATLGNEILLIDAMKGVTQGLGARGRPVYFDRAKGAVLFARADEYALCPLDGGSETVYRLLY